MEAILHAARHSGLLDLDRSALEAFRSTGTALIETDDAAIYRRSIRERDGIIFFMARGAGEKNLYLVGRKTFTSGFEGTGAGVDGVWILKAALSPSNARLLHEAFPFTAPVSLRRRTTTIGCGDRLGLASPGHIRAVSPYDVSPVLAQQSKRELALTGRDYPGVVADATFAVFQEGYEQGYGADGDHLKSLQDIDEAVAAGMPMITLDLTEVMSPEPASWSAAKVDEEFARLAPEARAHVLSSYAGKTFRPAGAAVRFPAIEAKRCALMYLRALDFARDVDRHLRERCGDRYDLEISIDETTAPTLPAHHLFFARELQRRGVGVCSLAPRFVGEFQKGIDYIGDVGEFEKQLAVHCAIAKASGGYKISIHSGSDKFSVFPPIGSHTGMHLHLKTAGTSWLQAVRVIARADPGLFRAVVAEAKASFVEASKLYHVTLRPEAVPDAGRLSDGELEGLLEARDSRQLLHITYGGILKNPALRAGIYRALAQNEAMHYSAVEEHIGKHLRLLGAPARP